MNVNPLLNLAVEDLSPEKCIHTFDFMHNNSILKVFFQKIHIY